MYILRSLGIFVVFSLSLVFSWQLNLSGMAQHPGQFAFNSALADEGGNGNGADPEPTIVNVSLKKFLSMNRLDLRVLDKRGARNDTTLHVEGFPDWMGGYIIKTASNDVGNIKRLLRSLSGVSDNSKRYKIIQKARKKQNAGVDLLKKDVSRTERQLQEEYERIRKAQLEKSKGIFRVKFRPSKRYKTLQKDLTEERMRLRNAQAVQTFFDMWRSSPEWGKTKK